MADRFTDARWYIASNDELNTITYDASDLEGTGPDGHGMVCRDAVLEDARLIAAAPGLRAIVLGFLSTLDVEGEDEAVAKAYYNQNIALFNAAIDLIQPLVEVE